MVETHKQMAEFQDLISTEDKNIIDVFVA